MSNPLFNGTEQETIFRSTLEIPRLPPGTHLNDEDDLREWLEKAIIAITSQNALFSYTAGPASSASADDRDKPRFLFDDQGRYIGLALYMPENQDWSLAGAIGEIKTVSRSESTVVADMEIKHLAGWFLCDGTAGGAPDLTPQEVTDSGGDTHDADPPAFFAGSAPEWDIYSVIKIS